MDTCKPEWNERLSAWFDGEADPAESRATEVHLKSCLTCRRVLQAWQGLRGKLRAGSSVPEVSPVPNARRARSRGRMMATVTAVAAMLIALVATSAFAVHRRPNPLLDELEQHHFQSFAKTSPCEFQSSDPDAVRGWLSDKVGFDVEVPKLEGASLLGARRCRLDGVLSASLLFRRGDSAVTVFIAPPDGKLPERLARLTDGEGRCTEGRLGERICSSHQPGALAVSNADDSTLIAYADAVVP